MDRAVGRAIAAVRRGLDNLLARAVVSAVESGKIQRLQVKILAEEASDRLEHFETFGLTSHPLAGAEALVFFIGGDRSHAIVGMVTDRRYRPTDLTPGQSCLYDKEGSEVRMAADGTIILKAGTKVRVEAPLLECTGEIKDLCESGGRTMSGMRLIYNGHGHPENDNGGPTDEPNESM